MAVPGVQTRRGRDGITCMHVMRSSALASSGRRPAKAGRHPLKPTGDSGVPGSRGAFEPADRAAAGVVCRGRPRHRAGRRRRARCRLRRGSHRAVAQVAQVAGMPRAGRMVFANALMARHRDMRSVVRSLGGVRGQAVDRSGHLHRADGQAAQRQQCQHQPDDPQAGRHGRSIGVMLRLREPGFEPGRPAEFRGPTPTISWRCIHPIAKGHPS